MSRRGSVIGEDRGAAEVETLYSLRAGSGGNDRAIGTWEHFLRGSKRTWEGRLLLQLTGTSWSHRMLEQFRDLGACAAGIKAISLNEPSSTQPSPSVVSNEMVENGFGVCGRVLGVEVPTVTKTTFFFFGLVARSTKIV